MRNVLRNVVAVGVAALMGMGPVASFAATSLGVYQTTDRKMDYQLTLCGTGQQLCVKLLDARGSARTKQTRKFIGKYIVQNAQPAGDNSWKGHVEYQGISADGTMTLVPGKSFVISGCAYFVVCQDFRLIAAKK